MRRWAVLRLQVGCVKLPKHIATLNFWHATASPESTMGQFSFSTPSPERLPPETVGRCYIAGMEGIPWASQNEFDDGVVLNSNSVGDSKCNEIETIDECE